ncbi:MAG: hypothetical protein JNL58_13190 [Planctomyces sp.]|nr:hypothetical protein [Planctomyces sp.]
MPRERCQHQPQGGPLEAIRIMLARGDGNQQQTWIRSVWLTAIADTLAATIPESCVIRSQTGHECGSDSSGDSFGESSRSEPDSVSEPESSVADFPQW